jgi:hypothetical protein
MNLIAQWCAIHDDMHGKLHRHDWHGVRDACVDLEIIETKMRERLIDVPKAEKP